MPMSSIFCLPVRTSPESTRSGNHGNPSSWLNCCPYQGHTVQHLRQRQSSCSARTLRPPSSFEQVDAMEKMSTRRALPGKHASSVIFVGFPRVVPRTHKVSNQTLQHVPCSLARLCHEPCYLLHRMLYIHAVDRRAARTHRLTTESRRSVPVNLREHLRRPPLHLHRGVITHFTFAPSRFICAY